MSALLDWIWLHTPIVTTRSGLERRNEQAGQNGFDLGRDYQRAVHEGKLTEDGEVTR